jgi:hypothetical protein
VFLNSGDGVVFKGIEGNWYEADFKEYHLSEDKASELMTLVLENYLSPHPGPRTELFIRGQTPVQRCRVGRISQSGALFNSAVWYPHSSIPRYEAVSGRGRDAGVAWDCARKESDGRIAVVTRVCPTTSAVSGLGGARSNRG